MTRLMAEEIEGEGEIMEIEGEGEIMLLSSLCR